MHEIGRDGDGDGHCYRIENCNACDRRDGDGMEVREIVFRIEAVMHVIKRDGDCDGHCYRIEAVWHMIGRDGPW